MANTLTTASRDFAVPRADSNRANLQTSYCVLGSRSLRTAERLRREFGVKPGDRVGIWLKNRPEYVPALFGILQAGAVCLQDFAPGHVKAADE
jgi:long-chain acyl-CoA synthetase